MSDILEDLRKNRKDGKKAIYEFSLPLHSNGSVNGHFEVSTNTIFFA
jgi:hypothetical protein